MTRPQSLAIIGSGPSAIYLLKHIMDHAASLSPTLSEIVVFEKNAFIGMGMPYTPQTTDIYNMSNISSEELPELPTTLADWLRSQAPSVLADLGLEGMEIKEDEVYGRLALGQYFKAQYQLLQAWLSEVGIRVHSHADCQVVDVKDDAENQRVTLFTQSGEAYEFDRVIIATGHRWPEKDVPEAGYYASPWPIAKLLPKEGKHYNFVIGTLGASLSAFDVISSLAHRHGDFIRKGETLTYRPHPGTEGFKMVMHSSKGLLPHLQFDQEEPMREIYRHVSPSDMAKLMDAQGRLRLETYFDQVCRPVLQEAFQKDDLPEMVKRLKDPSFKLLDFIEEMSQQHEYDNAFEGMRIEMKEAEESVKQHRPIHWKERVDDLIYTLNYYADCMPAEDHVTLHKKLMPFLLNVIAAMPLPSGNTILALYDAGKLEMIPGSVTHVRKSKAKRHTVVEVEQEDDTSTYTYEMFIDCSGQGPLELEDYPFPSLVKNKTVRSACAAFYRSKSVAKLAKEDPELLLKIHGDTLLKTGGIDIDHRYRVIGDCGKANPRIHDIAFPHTTGHRPYSYGLQACNDTSRIVVKAWLEEVRTEAAAG
ncbi:FAD/NAD(P)-binding protein [Prosthecobacter dejongeii]|uniref:Putative NAD(P)/FAD-binding protein YdhS n=1 Tax=Prosthecobacter dejongeii TaxID=48465 RepID=A0A7W7YM27_9BACT|nr:FAD/NAD(P)-binding protein [Prosthecobacter dejongeii]MBB5038460.1 putative NAD(P)/FAD-binding protein YdhS [Prosthecobacter dejongeii]